MATILISSLIGVLGGLSSGLFGVGGGLIYVPLLIFLRQFDPHLAVGTSIAIIIPTATVSAIRHAQGGMIHWQTALVIAVFAILGAWIGAGLSLKMDAVILRKCFAVFIALVALKLFFQN
ncbi:MAG: sulfite exporter TauE/SafE family protein [Candidatus Omnitrophica bacterium]|nr:sulfite exporter TauE/SafE family protein [Candidatus Omnitrophota bacterium]